MAPRKTASTEALDKTQPPADENQSTQEAADAAFANAEPPEEFKKDASMAAPGEEGVPTPAYPGATAPANNPAADVASADAFKDGRSSSGVIIDAMAVNEPDLTVHKVKVTSAPAGGGVLEVNGFGATHFEVRDEPYLIHAEVKKALDANSIKYELIED